MSVKLEAIKPNRLPFDTAGIRLGVDRELRNVAAEVVNKIAQYPPQEPTDYVRTGNLGRNWVIEPHGPGELWVVNRVTSSVSLYRTKTKGVRARRHSARAYAVYVQGPTSTDPGQSRVMQDKGWGNIEDVATEVFGRRQGLIVRLLTGEK